MDDLINEFLAETREMLEALGEAIVAWEADPGDRARLDEIFRFVHTVKGNSGFFDLPRLQRLSHAAEDCLAEVRAGRRSPDGALVSAVLAVIDRISDLVHALESGEPLASEDDDPLIAALAEAKPAAPAPVEAAPDRGEARRSTRSIRLTVDLLDRMMSGVSDAVLARNELARKLRESGCDPVVEEAFDRLSACIGDIRDAITRTRMQRIDGLFSALPRMVRDLSAELAKPVRLAVDGGDVELDREMIEMIRDPLTHIIRNAIDHGIEPATERVAAGKEEAGHLRVAARQAGNQILIEVSDDGRGVDAEALARKAIAAGVVAPEQAERLSTRQKIGLMFSPGLSTAREVTAISGRGVGMDVVRANIERIGGVIDVDSRPGEGLRLCIRVPLTLTIIPALTVSVAGQTFAIPRAAIEEILRPGRGVAISRLGESAIATVRGRKVPLVSLLALLGLEPAAGAEEGRVILLKPAGGDSFALQVDAVHDHEELVVKPAAPAVMSAGLYAGTTLADDGRPVLLLDPSGIAARAAIAQESEAAPPVREESEATAAADATDLLLFRTLQGLERAVPLALVERIEDVPPDAVRLSAGALRVAIGGRILSLAGTSEPPERPLRLLRLSDGKEELAYAFDDVVDIRPVAFDLKPAPSPGEVAGLILVEGRQVELLDAFWLFSLHGGRSPAAPVRCALPSEDPWMRHILRPMLENLGYQVVEAAEGVEADIAILSAEGEAPEVRAGQRLWLRDRPEQAGEDDPTIYRYDRAALIQALRPSARGG